MIQQSRRQKRGLTFPTFSNARTCVTRRLYLQQTVSNAVRRSEPPSLTHTIFPKSRAVLFSLIFGMSSEFSKPSTWRHRDRTKESCMTRSTTGSWESQPQPLRPQTPIATNTYRESKFRRYWPMVAHRYLRVTGVCNLLDIEWRCSHVQNTIRPCRFPPVVSIRRGARRYEPDILHVVTKLVCKCADPKTVCPISRGGRTASVLQSPCQEQEDLRRMRNLSLRETHKRQARSPSEPELIGMSTDGSTIKHTPSGLT